MALNGVEPDFAPKGDLSLKPWFGNNQGLAAAARARPAGGRGAAALRRADQGAAAAGGRRVHPPVDEGRLGRHGHGPGDAGDQPARRVDARRGAGSRSSPTCASPSCASSNGPNDDKLANVAIAAHVNLHGDPILAAADAAREAGNAPNAVLAAAASILGPRRVEGARRATETLLELFLHKVAGPARRAASASPGIAADAVAASAPHPTRKAAALLAALEARGARSRVRALPAHARRPRHGRRRAGRDRPDARLGAAAAQADQPPHRGQPALVPGALRHADRRLGAGRAARAPDSFCGVPDEELLRSLDRDRARRPGAHRPPARAGGAVLLPGPAGPAALQRPGHDLGPGCQGGGLGRRPRDARSGCSSTRRWSGFLTHTGFSHGGNGFEGIQLLLEQFGGQRLEDPGDAGHGLDLAAMATRVRARLQAGEGAAPGGRRPRARARSRASTTRCSAASRSTPTRARRSSPRLMQERGERNLFHDYYRAAGPGAVRSGRDQQRVLRQRRRRDRGLAAEAAVAALPRRRARTPRRWRTRRSPSSCSPGWRARRPRSRTTSTAAATWTPARRPRRCGSSCEGNEMDLPEGEPAIRTIAMPADTNPAGDIFGGWLMAQMDLAAGNVAARRARGRCATIAVDGFAFLRPVHVGDEVTVYADWSSRSAAPRSSSTSRPGAAPRDGERGASRSPRRSSPSSPSTSERRPRPVPPA